MSRVCSETPLIESNFFSRYVLWMYYNREYTKIMHNYGSQTDFTSTFQGHRAARTKKK